MRIIKDGILYKTADFFARDRSNATAVCFHCRITSRGPWGGASTCRQCGGKMYYIGKKHRVPRRRDDKAWAWLEETIRFCSGRLNPNKIKRKLSKRYNVDWRTVDTNKKRKRALIPQHVGRRWR